MIITDTGFWLALIDEKDAYHPAANQAFQTYDEPLITTWAVMTETCYLLLDRKGVQAQLKFIDGYSQNLFAVFDLELHHGIRIAQLMQKYANLPMDLADASLVILAEHLGHGRIFSVDQRDFNTYRWKNTQPFQNLLL
jgi:predicted nucleic acid-binding protein